MMRLSEFQKGKLGLFSPKIDRDGANNEKCELLKNGIFDKVQFLLKNCVFQNFTFCIIVSILVNFKTKWPNLPFWNSESLIIKHK